MFYDLHGLARSIEHWAVGSLDPDLSIAFGQAPAVGLLEFATVEPDPERAVFIATRDRRVDEHRMMVALNFVQGVTNDSQEIVIGGDNGAVHRELDHG